MERIIYKFEKLEVWQISLKLNDSIYKISNKLPELENFNLKSQIIRATTSISLNIAEGSTYASNAEQLKFLKISLHSLIEVIACLRLIEHRNYIKQNEPVLLDTLEIINLLFAKLNAFIKSKK